MTLAAPKADSQPWMTRRVTVFAGQHDSHIDTGEDYKTITLAQIFAMQPQTKPKMSGNAFLPSSYNSYDARSHDAQRQHGSFVTLAADIDKGNLSIEQVQQAVEAFAGGAAWLIYSSAHSRDGDQRWRAILPLDTPCGFEDWFDAQTAFFTYLDANGVPTDKALSRAGQPIYLPNVPTAYKDGSALRDAAGNPLFYKSGQAIGQGLSLKAGAVAGGIAHLKQKRAADDAERETLRRAAALRFEAAKKQDGRSLIEVFNSTHSVETMLRICDYAQSPRNPEDWRSPQQSGETFATRIIEGKWVSLSESDAASGLGYKCRAGCFGDAYDLYVHYKHGGDHKQAYRVLGEEQRGSNVVQGNFRGDDQDPGWQEMPEWLQPDDEPDYDNMVVPDDIVAEQEAGPELPGGVDPHDWEGKRAPHRQFIIPGWIVRGAAGLLSGQEGVGKSLIAQQMATCAALGIPFLGMEIARVNAMYVTCEDPLDELWRRQESINAALGCTMSDLQGRLRVHSLVGELGNELATFDSSGKMTPSIRYNQLVASSLQFGAQLTILDNAAHMFAGNENARHDVAAFLGLIERYSITINGAAILLAHPNKAYAQGAKQGNEYSGSTGWSAHVRNRLFIDYAPPPESGAAADPDERILRKSKANYGKKGEEVTFRWHEWAFVGLNEIPDTKAREIAEAAQAGIENERFLECLDKATDERRTVSVRNAAPNYAPRVFAKMTVARKMSVASFERALERLLHLGMIAGEGQVFKRDNRSWALGIVRSECTKQRTKHAQSGAQSDAQSAHDTRHSSALHSTPIYKYMGGDPEGSSPIHDEEGFFVSPDYDPADAWRASDAWEPHYD